MTIKHLTIKQETGNGRCVSLLIKTIFTAVALNECINLMCALFFATAVATYASMMLICCHSINIHSLPDTAKYFLTDLYLYRFKRLTTPSL